MLKFLENSLFKIASKNNLTFHIVNGGGFEFYLIDFLKKEYPYFTWVESPEKCDLLFLYGDFNPFLQKEIYEIVAKKLNFAQVIRISTETSLYEDFQIDSDFEIKFDFVKENILKNIIDTALERFYTNDFK